MKFWKSQKSRDKVILPPVGPPCRHLAMNTRKNRPHRVLPFTHTIVSRAGFTDKGDFEVDWRNHIEVNPKILVGKPIIKGTRISVELILDRVSDGWSMEDILTSYPHLTRADVLASLSFAAELFKEETFVAVGKLKG